MLCGLFQNRKSSIQTTDCQNPTEEFKHNCLDIKLTCILHSTTVADIVNMAYMKPVTISIANIQAIFHIKITIVECSLHEIIVQIDHKCLKVFDSRTTLQGQCQNEKGKKAGYGVNQTCLPWSI